MCFGLFSLSKKNVQVCEKYVGAEVFLIEMNLNLGWSINKNYPHSYLITNNICSCDLISLNTAHDKKMFHPLREQLSKFLKGIVLVQPNFAVIYHEFHGYFEGEAFEFIETEKIFQLDNELKFLSKPDVLYKIINHKWSGEYNGTL